MPRFLIDVNLPYRFALWSGEDYIHIGNMKMRDFHALITRIWPRIVDLSADHKLIRVFQDRIEAVE